MFQPGPLDQISQFPHIPFPHPSRTLAEREVGRYSSSCGQFTAPRRKPRQQAFHVLPIRANGAVSYLRSRIPLPVHPARYAHRDLARSCTIVRRGEGAFRRPPGGVCRTVQHPSVTPCRRSVVRLGPALAQVVRSPHRSRHGRARWWSGRRPPRHGHLGNGEALAVETSCVHLVTEGRSEASCGDLAPEAVTMQTAPRVRRAPAPTRSPLLTSSEISTRL